MTPEDREWRPKFELFIQKRIKKICMKNINYLNYRSEKASAYLCAGALALDAVPAAGEAELVVGHAGALDEVRVLEALLAEGALEGGRGHGLGSSDPLLLRRRHRRRGDLPRIARPPARGACGKRETVKTRFGGARAQRIEAG